MIDSDSAPAVHFFVRGKPQTAGSKRAFVNKKTGRAIVTDDNPKGKGWRSSVQTAALVAFKTTQLLKGPLALELCFTFARPKSHFGTGRNAGVLKTSAPAWPITRPDTTKLVRAVEDALTSVIWRDDAQIVYQVAAKLYGELPGAEVSVYTLAG